MTYKDVAISIKGQLTLPKSIRKALNLGTKRKVRMAVTQDGKVTLEPLPDVMSFFGKLKSAIPYDPHEKDKARQAMAHRASRKER